MSYSSLLKENNGAYQYLSFATPLAFAVGRGRWGNTGQLVQGINTEMCDATFGREDAHCVLKDFTCSNILQPSVAFIYFSLSSRCQAIMVAAATLETRVPGNQAAKCTSLNKVAKERCHANACILPKLASLPLLRWTLPGCPGLPHAAGAITLLSAG